MTIDTAKGPLDERDLIIVSTTSPVPCGHSVCTTYSYHGLIVRQDIEILVAPIPMRSIAGEVV